MAKSHTAIVRELYRVERAWTRERRRNDAIVKRGAGLLDNRRDEVRLEAARQALAWAAGDNAMSMSRIAAINERGFLRRRRAFQRQVRAGRKAAK